MRSLMQDLRYALRQLGRNPAFTAAALVTLALGVGAGATIFGVVNALLIRPLPVQAPEELVRVDMMRRNPDTGELSPTSWSYPDVEAIVALDDVFSAVAASHYWSATMELEDQVVALRGRSVTGNYFDVLGVRPVTGRLLQSADNDAADPAFTVVLSRAASVQYFGDDTDVVGRTIRLAGRPFTVVGTAGDERLFRALGEPDFWLPIHTRALLDAPWNQPNTRDVRFIPLVFGRRLPGVDRAEAQAAVETTMQQIAEAYPSSNAELTAAVRPASTLLGLAQAPERGAALNRASRLLLLVITVLVVLAIANVANLVLIRAVARRHEFGIRRALGAGRRRVARQLLVEHTVLALLGGSLALLVAAGGLALAKRIPEVAELSPSLDPRVIGFTLVVALLGGVFMGFVPTSMLAVTASSRSLRSGRAVTGRMRGQKSLIVTQLALATMLVVASGLVLETLRNLVATHPGFEPERVITVPLSVAGSGHPEQVRAAASVVLDEVRALPGVENASLSTVPHLSGSRIIYTIDVPGFTPPPGEPPQVDVATVGDEYFRTIGARLLSGSDFRGLPPGETSGVIVNQAAAQRFWPGLDPIGEQLVMANDTLTIVGLVGDIRHVAIAEEPQPMAFVRHPRLAWSTFTVHVRTRGDAAPLLGPLRDVARRANPAAPVRDPRPMREFVAESLAEARIVAAFFSILGALALLLAAVGLFGVLAYMVAQRTREIGIRSALGASIARITGAVVRESLALVALGVSLGLAAAYLGAGLIRGVLFGVEPTEPRVFVLGALVLLLVGAVAALVPARRAARVDPMIALRAE